MKHIISVVIFVIFIIFIVTSLTASENDCIENKGQETFTRINAMLESDMGAFIRLSVKVWDMESQEDQDEALRDCINEMGSYPVDRSPKFINEYSKRVLRLVVAYKIVNKLSPNSRIFNNEKISDLIQVQIYRLELNAQSPKLGKFIDSEIKKYLIINKCKNLTERNNPPDKDIY